MGYYARLSDSHGLTDDDAARLARDGLVEHSAIRGPITGLVLRNGQPFPYTLDTTNLVPKVDRVVPEQIAIAGLLLASFIVPIWNLLG
jgi:hypothetical protein